MLCWQIRLVSWNSCFIYIILNISHGYRVIMQLAKLPYSQEDLYIFMKQLCNKCVRHSFFLWLYLSYVMMILQYSIKVKPSSLSRFYGLDSIRYFRNYECCFFDWPEIANFTVTKTGNIQLNWYRLYQANPFTTPAVIE